MRVLLAGATGVVGRALAPLLRERGHHVTALVRSPEAAPGLDVDAVAVADALDGAAVSAAVVPARPDVVVHQLTALRAAGPAAFTDTARLRTEGTRHLVRAAQEAGARRMVAQSIAFATAPQGPRVLAEDAPLYLDAPDPDWALTVRAVADLERQVLGAADLDGVVLRYGTLYGPGTLYEPGGRVGAAVARGRLPLPRDAAGVTSFLHVEDAARAAAAAVDADAGGVVNVADDDPAEAADWVPGYARLLGAPPPRTVPPELAGRLLGWLLAHQLTAMRGAANDRARQSLGWKPLTPSWRTGLDPR
jgi:nucleoside-diphosphate-sugar epimerase